MRGRWDICSVCGKEFINYNRKLRHCSRACMGKTISWQMRGNTRWLGRHHAEQTRAKLRKIHEGLTYPRSFGEKVSRTLRGQTGRLCRAWKGGKVTRGGYRAVYVVPYGRYRKEHRIVMEHALGRMLLPTEVVHHVNGNKLDNRMVNLRLFTRSDHAKVHQLGGEKLLKLRCPQCGYALDIHPSKA